MFSSASCGSGKIFGRLSNARLPIARPSYIGEVLKKLRSIKDFQGLSDEELSRKAAELTESGNLWSVYFSGVVLDPARERIEKNLKGELEPEACAALHTANIHIKLQLKKPIRGIQYGVDTFMSLLLEQYGPLHALIVIDDLILLEWNTSGLVIPTGKAIIAGSAQAASGDLGSKSPGSIGTASNPYAQPHEEEILYEFEATSAKKEHIDKLIGVIVKYNRNYMYHPIFRGCQKFAVDVLSALNYPVHPKLEGNLGEYYNEVKKLNKRKLAFDSHSDLDAYVRQILESGGIAPLQAEYLLSQYFLFHVTSITEAEKSERWVCEVHGCLMSQLEHTIDLKSTIAYRMLYPVV